MNVSEKGRPPAIPQNHRRWLFLLLAVAISTPVLVLRALRFFDVATLPPESAAFLYGLSIVGAAFLLAWATEVAELDIPKSMALAFLAVIAVLPEYAVDAVFAYKAGGDPERWAPLAVANMTGANRLLIGVAWPLVVFLFWIGTRRTRREVHLEKSNSVELGFLGLATFYAFLLFLKGFFLAGGKLEGRIDLIDAGVLIAIFAGYVIATSRSKQVEPHLVGPAAAIASFPTLYRRIAMVLLFAFSAFIILISAEPFAEGLVETGHRVGIPEFVLVQWLAPLASEAPEVTIACIFVLQGAAGTALITMISSKVNQWTLLVGTLPIVFSIGAGKAGHLPLDDRQMTEFLLTSAQSLFGVLLLTNLRLGRIGALALFFLFITQLGLSTIDNSHLYFSFAYLVLAGGVAAADGRWKHFLGLFPITFRSLRSPIGLASIGLIGLVLARAGLGGPGL